MPTTTCAERRLVHTPKAPASEQKPPQITPTINATMPALTTETLPHNTETENSGTLKEFPFEWLGLILAPIAIAGLLLIFRGQKSKKSLVHENPRGPPAEPMDMSSIEISPTIPNPSNHLNTNPIETSYAPTLRDAGFIGLKRAGDQILAETNYSLKPRAGPINHDELGKEIEIERLPKIEILVDGLELSAKQDCTKPDEIDLSLNPSEYAIGTISSLEPAGGSDNDSVETVENKQEHPLRGTKSSEFNENLLRATRSSDLGMIMKKDSQEFASKDLSSTGQKSFLLQEANDSHLDGSLGFLSIEEPEKGSASSLLVSFKEFQLPPHIDTNVSQLTKEYSANEQSPSFHYCSADDSGDTELESLPSPVATEIISPVEVMPSESAYRNGLVAIEKPQGFEPLFEMESVQSQTSPDHSNDRSLESPLHEKILAWLDENGFASSSTSSHPDHQEDSVKNKLAADKQSTKTKDYINSSIADDSMANEPDTKDENIQWEKRFSDASFYTAEIGSSKLFRTSNDSFVTARDRFTESERNSTLTFFTAETGPNSNRDSDLSFTSELRINSNKRHEQEARAPLSMSESIELLRTARGRRSIELGGRRNRLLVDPFNKYL